MITDLHLQQFRSYKDATFEFGPNVNIIVGPNASGKTNVLEAVLVVAHGSSYRVKDTELIQFGAPWARIDAHLAKGSRIVKIRRDEYDRTTKSFEIDDHKLARLTVSRTLPIVLFEPNHLLMLGSSPDPRRQFLDDLLEQTVLDFGATRRHYKRVLAQRNRLLKINPPNISDELFVWNLRLSELGGKIAKERLKLIARCSVHLDDLYTHLSGREEHVELVYASSCNVEAYETSLLQKLEGATELDIKRGFTAYGPHRDDLQVSLGKHLVVEAASRGETRTLVLALKIIEAELLEAARNVRPLLLLDDVFSELDARRRQALTNFVAAHQTFITTTDADVVAQHFTGGTIIPTS